MGRIEPIKPVHPVSYTKDSTYKQKSQRDAESKQRSFREELRKAAEKKTAKTQARDTVTISEEAKRKYEQMQREKTQQNSLDEK